MSGNSEETGRPAWLIVCLAASSGVLGYRLNGRCGLLLNGGNYAATARQLGIAINTLRRCVSEGRRRTLRVKD